jgi:hypothetical protein
MAVKGGESSGSEGIISQPDASGFPLRNCIPFMIFLS